MANSIKDAPARFDFRIAAGIGLLALALRLGMLAYFSWVRGIQPLALSSDAIEYDILARALLDGWDWSSGYFAARPPLWPLLIAGIYRLFGNSQYAIAVFSTVLGATTAVVAFAVAAQLSPVRLVPIITGVLVAIDPASIANNINLQAETPANLFLALALLAFARLTRGQRMRDAMLAGFWVGLATLVRPTTLFLFLFALPLFLLLVRMWLWRFAVFALFPMIVLLGWSARNFAYINAFTYTTVSDFNMLFYRAVSVERRATRTSDDTIRRQYALEIEQRLGNSIDESEIDSGFFWRNFAPQDGRRVGIMRAMALDVFAEYPFWYFALIPSGLYRMYAYTSNFGTPFVPELLFNLVLYLLTVVGLIQNIRTQKWGVVGITLTIIIYITLATLASQTTGMDTRMRTSVTLPLALLAAQGIIFIWSRWRMPTSCSYL